MSLVGKADAILGVVPGHGGGDYNFDGSSGAVGQYQAQGQRQENGEEFFHAS